MLNDTVFSNSFAFYRFGYDRYHYTDNTKGSRFNYIGYMLEGNAKIITEKKTVLINTGDVFFIPYKLRYRSYWYGSEKTRWLSYGFKKSEGAEELNYDLQIIDCNDTVKHLITQIPTDGQHPKCKTLSIFYNTLSELLPYLKEIRKPTKTEEVVSRAKEYISLHTESGIPDIAKHCYVSEPYLFLCFKEKADCTPNEYRLRVISQKGCELLVTTDKSVEEISTLLGLSSASHFRKVLKKYTGFTPREIRKSRDL